MKKLIIAVTVVVTMALIAYLIIFVGNVYIVFNRHVFNSYYGTVDIDTAKTMDQILPWTHYYDHYRVMSIKYDSLNVKLDTINRYNSNTTADIYFQPWKQVYYIVLIDTIGEPHAFSFDPQTKINYGEIMRSSEKNKN